MKNKSKMREVLTLSFLHVALVASLFSIAVASEGQTPPREILKIVAKDGADRAKEIKAACQSIECVESCQHCIENYPTEMSTFGYKPGNTDDEKKKSAKDAGQRLCGKPACKKDGKFELDLIRKDVIRQCADQATYINGKIPGFFSSQNIRVRSSTVSEVREAAAAICYALTEKLRVDFQKKFECVNKVFAGPYLGIVDAYSVSNYSLPLECREVIKDKLARLVAVHLSNRASNCEKFDPEDKVDCEKIYLASKADDAQVFVKAFSVK